MWNSEPLQTREALEAILKELHEDDQFAIVLFDQTFVTWKDSVTQATKENVAEAITYVRQLQEKGC